MEFMIVMSQRAACTIITANYLAYAATLAETLALHNPGLPLYVLIVDPPQGFDRHQFTTFKPLYLDDFKASHLIEQMQFYYTASEFCWSLRGVLHEYMLEHTTYESWVFLDSDMMVSGSFDPIFQQLDQCSILLNPHFHKTGYLPAGSWIELSVLRVGKFNGGFLGLRRSPAARHFIPWFKERLNRFAFDEPRFEGMHVLYADQLWLDFVPTHFQEVEYLRHPGANLAHWNMFERDVVLHSDNSVTVDGEPLIFTHFSGWNIEQPDEVSRHSPMYRHQAVSSAWANLGEEYRRRLIHHGYYAFIQWPYGFGTFDDGQPILREQRRLYYNDWRYGTYPVDAPFHHPERFVDRAYPALEGIGFVKEELDRTQRFVLELQTHRAEDQQQQLTLQQQFAESQQQFAASQQELSASQEELSACQQELSASQEELSASQQELTEFRQQSAVSQQQQLIQSQHALSICEAQITTAQGVHETLQQDKQALHQEIQAQSHHIQALQDQIRQQQDRILFMESSKFWKLGCLWYTFWHRAKRKLRYLRSTQGGLDR
jgi:hypothetical protein